MARTILVLIAAVAWLAFVAPGSAIAHEPQGKKGLLKAPLAGVAGKEANVVLFDVGPGWKSAKHFHPGHVFVYVIRGSLTVEVEGQATRVVGPGNVFHELPDRNMVARNVSSTKGAKFVVFQIGDEGRPLTVAVE